MNAILLINVLEAWCTNDVMSQSGREPSLGSAYITLYLGPMTYPLNFGDDPDCDPDAGPGFLSLNSAEVFSLSLTYSLTV